MSTQPHRYNSELGSGDRERERERETETETETERDRKVERGFFWGLNLR